MNHTSFDLKGFASVKYNTSGNEIIDNLIGFFDWGLLNKENFFNVSKGATVAQLIQENGPEPFDFYNNNNIKLNTDISKLNNINSPSLPKGTVWKGIFDNWVWESGIATNYQPIQTSGVYINDTFYSSSTSGEYKHFIDYNNGQVFFFNPISSTSKVQVEHSFKWISVHDSDSFEGLKFIDSEVKDSDFGYRMPVIILEPTFRSHEGLQLGGGQWINTDVLFHCFATTDSMCERLMDIVAYQNDKNIWFFNKNKLRLTNNFPFTRSNRLKDINYWQLEYPDIYASGDYQISMSYKDLATRYPGYNARLSNVSVNRNKVKGNLFKYGTVKLTVTIQKNNI
jgi:hypothetical protein